jgi:enolase
MGAEVFHTLKKELRRAGHNTNVGDEGGFAPESATREALDFIMKAIERPATSPAKTIYAGARCAATEFFKDGKYDWPARAKPRRREMVDYLLPSWCADYPIISIEDGMAEDDWDGWKPDRALGDKVQLVGDDLFVTNPERLRTGIEKGAPTRSWSRSTRSAR